MTERVLFCGAWDEGAGYPRTRSLQLGLAAAGVDVAKCHVPGLGRDKQAMLRRPWRWPELWWRQRRSRDRLLARLDEVFADVRPDVVVVPYPGHSVVRAIRERVDVPIVLDLFLSAYDTVVEDRRLALPGSLLADYLRGLDRRACSAADLVVLDTPENAAYVQQLTSLPAERFGWLPVHDPDAPERALPLPSPSQQVLELLFFGTGVPLHGLSTLLVAVQQVPEVRLTLVGGTRDDRRAAVSRLGPRVRLEPTFVDRTQLQQLIARTHLVAGVFGRGGKAQRVVPFKVVHALAAGRGVITADTPAVARWLDGSGAVFACEAGDAAGVADELRRLVACPEQLAGAASVARQTYERHFGTARLAARWREVLSRCSGRRRAEVA